MKPSYAPMRHGWPREKMIAQWHKVAADPMNSRYPQVLRMAQEALANLHAEREREPGED